MKKQSRRKRFDVKDTVRPEYDFSGGVRGKHAAKYAEGTNVVVLEPDVAREFRTAEEVNETLRAVSRMVQQRRKRASRTTAQHAAGAGRWNARRLSGKSLGAFSLLTVYEFARITRRVIARDGFDDYLSTAHYPARKHAVVLEGVPDGAELEPIAMAWAAKGAVGDEEFLVAFKVDSTRFKVIRRHSGRQEEGVFHAEGDV